MIGSFTARQKPTGIKADFVFQMDVSEHEARRDLRSHRDSLIEVLTRVRAVLAAKGFEVTEAGPGKGCDAGFEVVFQGFNIFVMASVGREYGATLECILAIVCIQVRRQYIPKPSIREGWASVADLIAQGLEKQPNIISMEALTKEESSCHPAFHPSLQPKGQSGQTKR